MHIFDILNNENKTAIIQPVRDEDFKILTIKRYFFDWKKLRDKCSIFKLVLTGSSEILGLIALSYFPDEERIEIKLVCVSRENFGSEKQYDNIAGCLFAFAGLEAVKILKNYPCISLIPKTRIKNYYIEKYSMFDGGRQLYLEDKPLFDLINKYL